jgi:hypothetical protein
VVGVPARPIEMRRSKQPAEAGAESAPGAPVPSGPDRNP